jgi:hypothetical protein
MTSDKGANFFCFPLISNPFFLIRVRSRSWLLETTGEITDLNVLLSIRIAEIGEAVILLSIVLNHCAAPCFLSRRSDINGRRSD